MRMNDILFIFAGNSSTLKLNKSIARVIVRSKNWALGIYHKFADMLRLVVLPGFKGMPLYDVLVFFLKSFTKGRLMDRAAAVAFNFFLSIFPLVLFFFTLIPYVPIPHLYEQVLDALKTFLLPSGTYDYLVKTIDDIMNQPHGGLLSTSIVLCLIFGSSGISAIFNGFKNAYLDYGSYGWFKQRVNSLFLLIIIGTLIFLSIALISLGFITFVTLERWSIITRHSVFVMVTIARWLMVVFMLMLCMSLLYYFGNKNVKKFKLFSPGSLFATGLFILATLGFNVYIVNFTRYNALYGSIGTLIVFLMWLWIVAIIILAGNYLNVSINAVANEGTYESQRISELKQQLKVQKPNDKPE